MENKYKKSEKDRETTPTRIFEKKDWDEYMLKYYVAVEIDGIDSSFGKILDKPLLRNVVRSKFPGKRLFDWDVALNNDA